MAGRNASEAQQIQAMESGVLFPFVKNVKLYKCPTAVRGELSETYTLLVAAGRSFHCAASGEPEFLLYIGIQLKL